MVKPDERRQEHLKFDAQMQFLEWEFKQIPDHRANNVTYSLASVLQAAFAMFSLKSPSLLDFQTQTVVEESNLRSIYRIKGQTPGDTQMRSTLDYLVDAAHLRALFPASVSADLRSGNVVGLQVLAGICVGFGGRGRAFFINQSALSELHDAQLAERENGSIITRRWRR